MFPTTHEETENLIIHNRGLLTKFQKLKNYDQFDAMILYFQHC